MNPLGSRKPTINPMIQNIADTLRFARSFQSPEAFMQELQRQNPQMAQQLAYLAQTVKNPSQAAQQMLAQQGISFEQLQAALNQK
jgi:hypothetical protein